jgi:hypothetical protein
MTHNIIKTDNYLLIVSDEIPTTWYYDTYLNQVRHTGGAEYGESSISKKVIGHLPLNNSPVLEFVPLLPLLEDDNKEVWDQGLAAELEKLPYTKHLDDGQYNDGQLAGFEFGATWGYNKAQEKYKYTEEDLRKCWKACLDFNKPAGGDSGINLEDFIQSLQQPKMPAKRPVAFECEMENKIAIDGHTVIGSEPKTTTNPQGQTVLVGKYIY